MNDRRIIFLLEPFAFPSGGVAVIYRHAEILAEHGFQAFVALPQMPKTDFYGSKARLIVFGTKFDLRRGDIIVFPEGFSKHMEMLKNAPVRRIMFCQNQYYMPFTANPSLGFAEYNVDAVVVSSKAIRSFMLDVYCMKDVPLIPYAIDPSFHVPNPRKLRQIAFMPRKLPRLANFIRGAFQRRHPRYAAVPWVSIHGTSQREAAAILGESEVFLSLSHEESFGLPPLEAMSCGCMVAGFHGDGGREFTSAANGWWAETGDWKACVDGLASALDLLQNGGNALAERQSEMVATVKRYSPERMQSALLEYWRQQIEIFPQSGRQ